MSVSKEQVVEFLSSMSVIDLANLVKELEGTWGVSAAAAAPVMVAAGPAAAAEAPVEQTEFNVILTGFGENKIGVIKVVRELTGLGLKEAKDLVEGVPSPVKEGVEKADAEKIKKALVDAGATADIK